MVDSPHLRDWGGSSSHTILRVFGEEAKLYRYRAFLKPITRVYGKVMSNLERVQHGLLHNKVPGTHPHHHS